MPKDASKDSIEEEREGNGGGKTWLYMMQVIRVLLSSRSHDSGGMIILVEEGRKEG